MKVYLASDHAGFELKGALATFLEGQGFEVEDLGPHKLQPGDDYPLTIEPLAQAVASEKGSRGIAIGGSGQGEAMAANRVRGARAAEFYGGGHDALLLSRRHNDANILALGARLISPEEAQQAALAWLREPFSGDARHRRRIGELG
ncbi:MAG: RpiB/LacA/LacB family sugar-phosphate isomerase [Patescibacteria group bacterium]|nr:RpiB/LacA/LacB family sugar-phosphate isomerase [Patescibacteria group bacterium]